MKLTHQEANEPLWLKLKAHFEGELADIRLKNENINLTDKQFAYNVGQIKLFVRLIAMDSAARPKE